MNIVLLRQAKHRRGLQRKEFTVEKRYNIVVKSITIKSEFTVNTEGVSQSFNSNFHNQQPL